MPSRYVCKKCSNVKKKKEKCSLCGSEVREVKFEWTWRTALPYIIAGIGAALLILSHVFNMVLFIWITLILVAVGLVLDHLYQKELDKTAKDKIKNSE